MFTFGVGARRAHVTYTRACPAGPLYRPVRLERRQSTRATTGMAQRRPTSWPEDLPDPVWLDVERKPQPGDLDYDAPRRRRGRAVVSRPGDVHYAGRPALNARQIQAQIHVAGRSLTPPGPYRAEDDDYSLWKFAKVTTSPPNDDDDEMGEYSNRGWWDGSGAAPAAAPPPPVHPFSRDPDASGEVSVHDSGPVKNYITITADSPTRASSIKNMLSLRRMQKPKELKAIMDRKIDELVPIVRAAVFFMQQQRANGSFTEPKYADFQGALRQLIKWGVARVSVPAIRSTSLGVSAEAKYTITTPLYVKMDGHFAELTADKSGATYRTARG